MIRDTHEWDWRGVPEGRSQRVETPAARRTRRTRRRAIAVILVLAVAGGAAFYLSRPRPRYATEPFTNETGAYSFAYPPGWRVEEQGTATRVTSPDRRTNVSFGLAAGGSLEDASAALTGTIRERYRDVTLGSEERTTVGERAALAVAGVGTNEAGTRVRFLAITVEGDDRGYSIVVFTAADADPDAVLPPAQEIVDSFEPA